MQISPEMWKLCNCFHLQASCGGSSNIYVTEVLFILNLSSSGKAVLEQCLPVTRWKGWLLMWYTLLPYMMMSVFDVIYRTQREDSDSESMTQIQTCKHRIPYTQWQRLCPCFHSFFTVTLNESDHKSSENGWQSCNYFFLCSHQ